MQLSGTRRTLVLIRNGEVTEVRGDRFSIGGSYSDAEKKFTERVVTVQSGDMLYLFSDGYADQFGGPAGKKFMYRNFLRLLKKVSSLSVDEQKSEPGKTFDEWKRDLEQVDDVLVVGIRIT
ncbi:MAG TPA: SpoIIE family protein phosphatase [Bacteroidia bacterium]|nr:SpoIIE family protein phosphatase [Bacteroidia bacterium]